MSEAVSILALQYPDLILIGVNPPVSEASNRLCCKLTHEVVDIRYPLQRSRAGQAEGLVNEQNLPGNFALGQPAYLPFPDHVNRFVTCNRPLRPAEGSKSLFVSNSPFNSAVVVRRQLNHPAADDN